MRHALTLSIGPVAFRIGSDWRAPIDQLRSLYRDYPAPIGPVADFTVRLAATRPWRRLIRPSVSIAGDYMLPDAAPLPPRHGLLAAEMAMNLQVALGERRFLLLHAATVERGGRAIVMTGESGSGKSTLAALLMARGWRLLGDEFALIDCATGAVHPFPRLISLKNASIETVRRALPDGRFGPVLRATPKGDICHLVPDAPSTAASGRAAQPVALIFPRFGFATEQRPVGAGEAFVRLTQASTNYVALGERGFAALTRFVTDVPAIAIDFPTADDAIAIIEELA